MGGVGGTRECVNWQPSTGLTVDPWGSRVSTVVRRRPSTGVEGSGRRFLARRKRSFLCADADGSRRVLGGEVGLNRERTPMPTAPNVSILTRVLTRYRFCFGFVPALERLTQRSTNSPYPDSQRQCWALRHLGAEAAGRDFLPAGGFLVSREATAGTVQLCARLRNVAFFSHEGYVGMIARTWSFSP